MIPIYQSQSYLQATFTSLFRRNEIQFNTNKIQFGTNEISISTNETQLSINRIYNLFFTSYFHILA